MSWGSVPFVYRKPAPARVAYRLVRYRRVTPCHVCYDTPVAVEPARREMQHSQHASPRCMKQQAVVVHARSVLVAAPCR